MMTYLKTNGIRIWMAIVLAGYGVAILLRPNASIATVSFIEARLGITPFALALLFISAAVCMTTHVHWLRVLALIPISAYSIASMAFIIPRTDLTLIAVVQHAGLATLMILLVEAEWRREYAERVN
jgi:hypothetical protein